MFQNTETLHGVIRKFVENTYHFYIVWSIELILQHILLQNICSRSVTTCLMLGALQLSSRQRHIVQTSPFYIAFWRFTSEPIQLPLIVKFCYAVIAHIAFHAYLMTYLLVIYANFQRFITNGWSSKSQLITVLSKGKVFNFYEPFAWFWHINSLN